MGLTSGRSSIPLLHLSLCLPPLPHAHLPKVVNVVDVCLRVGIEIGVGLVVAARGWERGRAGEGERKEGEV